MVKTPDKPARTPRTTTPKAKAKSPSSARTPRSPRATAAATKAGAGETSASRLIDQRIRDLAGWRGDTLARMRRLILEADAA
ncbi:MAG TPA: hypothetical protein VM347_02825 [Nonomuraea sp.]|nr:hypothetical protein [Nonomuraea sp.]